MWLLRWVLTTCTTSLTCIHGFRSCRASHNGRKSDVTVLPCQGLVAVVDIVIVILFYVQQIIFPYTGPYRYHSPQWTLTERYVAIMALAHCKALLSVVMYRQGI